MRLLVLAVSSLLFTGCSGKWAQEWKVWEVQILQLELVGQVTYTHLVDDDWIASGDLRMAEPVGEKECKKGGSATVYDNGSFQFHDCKTPNGDVVNGGLVAVDASDTGPQEFIYDEFTIVTDGDVHTLDGGYTAYDEPDGRTRVEAEILLTMPDFDKAGEENTVMTGTVWFGPDETVDGTLTIETLSPWGNHTTSCDYQGMPLDEFIEIMRGDPDVPELNCPPSWDEGVKIVVRRIHEHDGDQDNIHIAFPDEAIGDAPRLRPGRKKRTSFKTTIGERIVMSVGRGGVVWDTAWCPPAVDGKVYDAVYDDGLGLDSYAFYCTVRGDDPYYGLNEPTQ